MAWQHGGVTLELEEAVGPPFWFARTRDVEGCQWGLGVLGGVRHLLGRRGEIGASLDVAVVGLRVLGGTSLSSPSWAGPGWWGSGRGPSVVVGPWVLGGTSFVSWA